VLGGDPTGWKGKNSGKNTGKKRTEKYTPNRRVSRQPREKGKEQDHGTKSPTMGKKKGKITTTQALNWKIGGWACKSKGKKTQKSDPVPSGRTTKKTHRLERGKKRTVKLHQYLR